MRQALHIFRKDLRQGWPLLLLWAAVLAYWIAPVWSDPLDADDVESVNTLRGFLVAVAGSFAAAMVVQYDALVGTREFWMTRPIGRWTLLAAKASYVGLFFGLPPILLQLAVLARFGLPTERWPLELATATLSWAGVLAAASLLASWTRSIAGFFAAGVGLLLLINYGLSIVQAVRSQRGLVMLPPGILATVGSIAIALFVLQYATRRRALGIGLGAAAVVAAGCGLIPLDPYGYLEPNLKPTLPAIEIAVTPGPGRETFAVEQPGETGDRVMDLWFAPKAKASSAGRSLQIWGVEGEIEWNDGRKSPFYSTDWNLTDGLASHAGLDWANGVARNSRWRALGIKGGEPFASLLGGQGKLREKAHATVWEHAETATLLLVPGAEYQREAAKVRIASVEHAPGALEITVRTRQLVERSASLPRMQMALANRARGEAIPLRLAGSGGAFQWGGLLASSSVQLVVREGSHGPWPLPGLGDDGALPVDADWLAGAELLLVFYERAGYAEVTLDAAELTVDSDPNADSSLVWTQSPYFY